jgi:hypothetical protein
MTRKKSLNYWFLSIFCLYLYKQIETMKKNKTDCMAGFRTTKEFIKIYHNFCDQHGYNFSKRIKLFLEKDLDGKIKIL